ncbi:MAG: hypothetical protein DRP74_06815, partial [Candidatus Omnitrophota bacterium]
MPTFIYKAKKGPKETIEGVIEAENREAAVAILNKSGLIPINVELKALTRPLHKPAQRFSLG